ncbi:hypothetical protein BHM03_00048610 [Ensete ventricosum]|nr:hypothetical protein BHM03_00048610 [Ensete ventricosum]
MLAMATTKGIVRDCSELLVAEEAIVVRLSSRMRKRMTIESEVGAIGVEGSCGVADNGEKTTAVGSCGYDRGLEMTALCRGRRGVGAGDNDNDTTREPNDGVLDTVAGDSNIGRGGGDDKGGAALVGQRLRRNVSVRSNQRWLRLRRVRLCGLQAEDGGGDSRGDVTKRLREVVVVLEMKRRGGTAVGAGRLYNGGKHRSAVVAGRGRKGGCRR